MKEEMRKEVIPDLDQLMSIAKALEKEIDYLRSRHDLYKDHLFIAVSANASGLLNSLRSASDSLKREGANRVQSYLVDWHHMRTDDDVSVSDPTFESVSYDGNDTWIVFMQSTYGREKVVVYSDGATWESVYSADSEATQ